MVKKVAIIVAAMVLASCAHSPIPLGIPCDVFARDGEAGFQPDSGASGRWTDDEKMQLVVLNETGERFCGWKP